MHDLIAYTIFGLVTASIYAIAASGLVVTYTTSGVFNLAHGAVGMLGAFVEPGNCASTRAGRRGCRCSSCSAYWPRCSAARSNAC